MIKPELLYTFCRVYDTGSMTIAARELQLSQSTVSKRITSLEAALGQDLFQRRGRDLEPTSAASRLYPVANRILSAWTELTDLINTPGLAAGSIIRFAASNVPGQYLLPLLWREFQSDHPGIVHHSEIVNSTQAQSLLTAGNADLALIGQPPGSDFRYLPIAEDHLVVIAPPGTESTDIDSLLVRGPWIWREPGSAIRSAARQFLTQRGLQPESLPSAGEFGSSEGVISAVRSGLGISCMSLAALRHRDEVAVLPGIDLSRSLYLAAPAPQRTQPAAGLFWQFCTARLERCGPVQLSG